MTKQLGQLLTADDVLSRCRISKATLYRLVKSGGCPAPIRIGLRAVRWRESELNAWLSGRPYSHGDRAKPQAV